MQALFGEAIPMIDSPKEKLREREAPQVLMPKRGQ
jgi:hypothetical protein